MSINTNQDYIQFKNDILKDIREFEKKMVEQIKLKYSTIDSSLFNYKDKIDKLEKQSKSSSANIIELKTKLNSFNEFFSFKEKVENMVFNHDIKLKIANEEIEKVKTKYDKILDENLIIPGILGKNSKFKNLKDYIQNNNNEIARLKYFLDEEKRLTSEFKNRFEVLPKSMINMADSAVRRSNEYTEIKQKDLEKYINIQLNDNNEKMMEIKVNNLENKKYFDEIIEDLKNEINQLKNTKSEIQNILNEKMNLFEKMEKDNDTKMKKILEEIDEVKKEKIKSDEQITNNTQLINEINNNLKNLNGIVKNIYRNNNNYYYNNDTNKKIEYTNSNNTIPVTNNVPKKIIEPNKIIDLKKRKNNLRKSSLKETLNNNIIKDYCFSDFKSDVLKKDIENEQNKSFNEKKVKSVKKINENKIEQTKRNNNYYNNNNKKNNDQNNILAKKIEYEKKLQLKIINNDSSSLDNKKSENDSDRITNEFNNKSDREMRKLLLLDSNKKNNNSITTNEDKINENKEFNYQDNNLDLNPINEKKEFELNIIKSKINKNKNKNKKITRINNSEGKRLSQISKFNINNININEDDKSDKMSINYLNSSNNRINLNNNENNLTNNENNLKNNEISNFNNEINLNNKEISLNNKEINELNINNYIYKKENEIFTDRIKNKNNKNHNIRTIYIDKKNKNNNYNIEIANKIINNQNNNIINNIINKKNNIYFSNNYNFENTQNNNNIISQKKIELNLGAIDSFLYSNKMTKNKKYNISTQNFSSRNDNRNCTKNQSCDIDVKVNNIDLFANAKKSIHDRRNSQYYSFNGKKIKSNFKNKKDDEEKSPTDYLYKLYFDKKIKKDISLKDNSINNVKRITSVFGRTAYTFYDKNENSENKNLLNNFL